MNVLKALAIGIGLVLLALVAKTPGQSTQPGGYPMGRGNNYPEPMNGGYAPVNNRGSGQGGGCLRVLAIIGFLAICGAGIMIGIALVGTLG